MENDSPFIENSIVEFNNKLHSSSIEDSMRSIADHLRRQVKEEEGAISLRPLMDLLGVDYKYSKYEAIDINSAACLRVKDGKFQILVNQGRSSNWRRARFSIAHEIGHLIFIMYCGIDLTYKMQSSVKYNKILEDCCDIFAQELLLPRKLLIEDIKEIKKRGFLYIHRKYAVSEQVAMRAVVDATPATSWIILNDRPHEFREDIKLRVEYCYPIYKSGGEDRLWLPRNFGSNRIVRSSEPSTMVGYRYMNAKIRVGKIDQDVLLTQVYSQDKLDFLGPRRFNFLVTTGNNLPGWINE